MMPIIYGADEQSFTSMGIGRIIDTISGSVKEKLNGLFELTLSVPEGAQDADLLVLNNFLYTKGSDKGGGQPFRIYRVNPVANGKIQVYARHRTYDLAGVPVLPFTATGVVPALQGLISHSAESNPFTVWTDISNTDTIYTQDTPLGFRQCLGGVQGSILDRFGGEYEWDVDTIKLHAHRGEQTDIYIQYKKNLTAFAIDRNNDSAYTGCIAFWKSDEAVVTGELQKVSDYQNYPIQKDYVLDCSSDFEEQPSEEQLNARAVQYMSENSFGVPWKDSLKVSFAPLWQTEEYKQYASLERVGLGDFIHVVYKDYDLLMQVIETDYDFINERYNSITLGTKKASLSSKVADIASSTQSGVVKEAVSMMQGAIDHAAEVMAGGTGGFIVIGRNADGQPNEIYIMDSPDMGTAINVMRMNYAGIAFSQTGINGTYTTAWTIDSNFVADFITAGTFNGNLIRAGSILTSALEVAVQALVDNLKLNFSFLSDGLHVATKDGNTIVGAYQTILSDLGMRVIETSTNNATIVAEQDTVTAVNLTAEKYFRIRSNEVSFRAEQFYSSVHEENELGLFIEV